MHRLKITSRLQLGFGLLMGLLVVIVATAVGLGAQTREAVQDFDQKAAAVDMLKDIRIHVRTGRALVWEYISTGEAEVLAKRSKSFDAADNMFATLDKTLPDASDRATLNDIRLAVATIKKDEEALISMKMGGVPLAAPAFKTAIETFAVSNTKYNSSAMAFIDANKASRAKALGVANVRLDQAAEWSLVIGIAGLLVGGCAAWFIGGSISKPIVSMTTVMSQIAQGDLGVDVPSRTYADEIGAMARAVQIFKENGLRLKQTEADVESNRQAAEAERAAFDAARAEVQRQQEAVVASIASGLDRLSKGDLTSRLNQAFTAEYEKLRADFNATADSLRVAISTIATATNGISVGSDQIAHASDDLSKRTEQQAASLEETSATLNMITQTMKAMAENAADAAKVVLATRAATETSGTVVQQAVQAMGLIRDSSSQIGKIVGVIDEIAFQTNLLALNAGVEAARAGEAGRGFAVVASEVRALAQRSTEAAKEIKALISSSSAQVVTGVTLVDKTGAAFNDIAGKLAEMDILVQRISSSSREQATGISEINIAVSQMDQVVQKNAAMVEESTAAAHALKEETRDLTTMVGRFQTGVASTQTNPVHAAQAKLAVGFKTASRPMQRSSGSAARQTAAVENEWEEF